MDINEEHKEHLDHLLDTGEKIEAVRYVQETFHLSADQALTMVDKLDKQRSDEADEEMKAEVEKALKQGPNVATLVGTIFGILGLIFLAVSFFLFYRGYQFGKTAEHVTGKVIDMYSYESRDRETRAITTMYAPIVNYTFKGKAYTYRSTTASSPPSYSVGDDVDLMIAPDDPQNPEFNSFIDRWLVSIIFGFMGVLFSGIGFGIRKAFTPSPGHPS